ncbi:3-oxoacyl-ACP synthase III family protein [Sediminibacterium sp.]|uniref:3-oxoacyl-ACP synthase III family protein n=1 Tax=Sediminibacterium sp. TaxID=1917865 RepID=UPI003F6E57A0
MKAKIKAISYYLPADVLSNDSINNQFPEWSADKISEKTGIYQRHISGKDEFSSDMACNAANKLFEEHSIDKRDIDFILLCTQSPDYFLPTTACILQNKLGIPTSCGALDFNLGCSGFVYGLALAKGLIIAGIAKNIMLITSETYSKFIHPRDKSNRTIFGDAAAATLVSTEGIAEIMDFELGTDGSGAENLIVKNGGMRHPLINGKDKEDQFGNIHNDDKLFMEGSKIFNFTNEAIPRLIKSILKKHSLENSDIDLYVFHQANKFILNHLRKKIGIEENKFYYFLKDCGNTVSSTVPIALYEAIKEKKATGNVLIAGFGVGYSWGSAILKF